MRLQSSLQDDRVEASDRSPFRPRRYAFLLSAFAHLVVFGIPPALEQLQWLPSMETHQLDYLVTIAPLRREMSQKQEPLYEPRLPKIAPLQRIGKAPEPQGRIKTERETVIVQSPRPVSDKQHIWLPETKTELKKEVPAANVITLRAPVRRFEVPRANSPGSSEQTQAIPLPKVDVSGAAVPKGDSAFSREPELAPPPPLPRFAPPARRPLLQAPRTESSIQPMSQLLETGRRGLPSGSAIERAAEEELRNFEGKPPAMPFRPPPGTGGSGSGGGGAGEKGLIDQPPPMIAGGTGGQRDLAVIGLQPDPSATSIPGGNLPGQFSQAPKLGEPSSGETARADTPRIPGLAVGEDGSGLVPPPARSAIPRPKLLFEMAAPSYAKTTSAPLRPSARTLPAMIESAFQNRIVYTLVVSRPTLPEYTGDWIIWFAVEGEAANQVPQVRPPFPCKKYEVRYVSASDNRNSPEEGWVRMKATLGKDGKVLSVSSIGRRQQRVVGKRDPGFEIVGVPAGDEQWSGGERRHGFGNPCPASRSNCTEVGLEEWCLRD